MPSSSLQPVVLRVPRKDSRSHPRPLKRLKRTLRYGLLRAALGVWAWLPLEVARALGERLGALAFRFAGRQRAWAQEGLKLAFPEKTEQEREALLGACFRHLGRSAMEVVCIRKLDARLAEEVRLPAADRAVLERALARGKGVVFVAGHVGHWELLARRVASEGFPCQSIARETTDARLTAWVERFRAQGGVRSIWRGAEGAARQMLRALKAGEILGLLIDQDTEVQSFWVPFFGRPAKTPRAAADLALRTGAAVVVGFCPRDEDGRYTLSLEEIVFTPTGEREEDARELTALLSHRIEDAVRRIPEQWVWMHRRWKSPPP